MVIKRVEGFSCLLTPSLPFDHNHLLSSFCIQGSVFNRNCRDNVRHCPCLQVFNLVRERKKYDVYPTNNTNRDLVVARGEVKESFIGQRTFLAVGIEQFFHKGQDCKR